MPRAPAWSSGRRRSGPGDRVRALRPDDPHALPRAQDDVRRDRTPSGNARREGRDAAPEAIRGEVRRERTPCFRPTSTSSFRQGASGRRGPRSGRRAAVWSRLHSARSRSRGVDRSDPHRRRECRSGRRGDGATSPNTRGASPASLFRTGWTIRDRSAPGATGRSRAGLAGVDRRAVHRPAARGSGPSWWARSARARRSDDRS